MIIQATKLFSVLGAKEISKAEFTRRINKVEQAAGIMKRPMIRQTIHSWKKGHAPPQDRLYIAAALLGVHPSKIFGVVYDEQKLKKYKELVSTVVL